MFKTPGSTAGGLISEFQGITGSYAREGQPLERHLCGPVFGSEAAAHLQERIVRQRQGRINALLTVRAVVSRDVRIAWMRERCRFQADAELPIRAGFTLIEMAIVLVIIGLIVGGVLVGQELIYTSQVRSVMTDIQRFDVAANTFRGKYDCVPGDCANATYFFGINSGGCPGPAVGYTSGTCNGDGNGQVDGYLLQPLGGTTAYGGISRSLEVFLFWQHLSLANLIPGSYTGEYCHLLNQRCEAIGENIPGSNFRNIGYTLVWLQISAGTFGYLQTSGAHTYMLGIQPDKNGTSSYESMGWFLTPSEANAIDNKYDDGSPVSGRIRSLWNYTYVNSAADLCITSTSMITARWNTALTTGKCSLSIKAAF